jgi:hypothetical protein
MKKEEKLQEVILLLREKVSQKQFEKIALDWLGWDRITEDFFDSFENYEHEEKDLDNYIKEYNV